MDDLAMAVYNKMTSDKFIKRYEELATPPVDRFAMEKAESYDDNELPLGV